MTHYLIKRLLLLPLTLFLIVFVNFCIINLAPGEPVYLTQRTLVGEAARSEREASGMEDRYLQFRSSFGLTLPLIFNYWPQITQKRLLHNLDQLATKKEEMSAKDYSELKVRVGDQSVYLLDKLLHIAHDEELSFEIRKLALTFFFRGTIRFVHVGPHLSIKEKEENQEIVKNALYIDALRMQPIQTQEEYLSQLDKATVWFQEHQASLTYPTQGLPFVKFALVETRFCKYMEKVLSLDFGVTRNDPNRTVISEVAKRLKISLTLAVLPMIVTFLLCLFFGLVMAIFCTSFLDRSMNLLFLALWACPVFVVAPFLIEKVALNHTYPFTDLPFPIRGFSSEESLFSQMTSLERLMDVARHITLPLACIFYGSLAMQTRLSRSVFLDTLHHDFVRTAKAKGVGLFSLYFKHVGRHAAIPIITSIAGSLGVILGGSVIIETIFEIHGFGKFFYDAVINRDYNVMMFSALMGSFLALVGYLIADLCYMSLDPRVTLTAKV